MENPENNTTSEVGLGVDIVDVNRIKNIIERTPNFLEFTFSEDEIKYCKSTNRWAEHFATHFAAKEAVLKALGTGFMKGCGPKDIEVFHNKRGKPYVKLYGVVKQTADEQGIVDIPISLSFTNNDAVGFAIAITNDMSVQKSVFNKNNDPVVELTRKFNEAKKLLDEHN